MEDYEMKARWAHWPQREGDSQGFLLQETFLSQGGNRAAKGHAEKNWGLSLGTNKL